ncbi:MAG: 50S ribosomal protein L10 [Candidatus Chisholmbacteria bacterium RIFCSPHIGHO2_01_FULL_48_12]|uniref:Large ribosomal subunit protein uL10 n=1 Tax=Candidatus Chisholmbacteria bacterium RIFCSPHIGHO2_01_FULL_48_12 TaxID=1797589 RepID=A0A1G1VRK6_9BACT|nr:MAG: 50S ribosomal protein L10 [Candidatus Chisholmbacteria bacterium RIFCSPHIGHO2_01_FULL_48_12]
MPSAKNISLVAQLESQLAKAKALILADYRGLSVADIQNLRAQVRASGGSLTVAKNTLLKIALKHQDLEPALQGPTALILSLGDAIAPIKVLVEFARGHALNIPTPKAGLLDDRVLTATDIKFLATLPSRDQLIAQLLTQLQTPASSLVTVLQANFRSLVYVLTAVKSKKEVN